MLLFRPGAGGGGAGGVPEEWESRLSTEEKAALRPVPGVLLPAGAVGALASSCLSSSSSSSSACLLRLPGPGLLYPFSLSIRAYISEGSMGKSLYLSNSEESERGVSRGRVRVGEAGGHSSGPGGLAER